MDIVVRLEALRIQNLKNINKGEVYFSEKKKLERNEYSEETNLSNVLGIYGQNGSGKTTALDALSIIQLLLSSNPLKQIILNYINIESNEVNLGTDFFVKLDKDAYYVYYDISIIKENNYLSIKKEKLSYFKLGSKERKNNIYEYSSNGNIIKPTFIEKLNLNDRVRYEYTCLNETCGYKNKGFVFSSIFNYKLLDIINNNKDNLKEYKDIVNALSDFATNKMYIFTINYFNENENVGIRFRTSNQVENNQFNGNIFVPFVPSGLDNDSFVIFENIIDKINKVMPSIIPNYRVKIIQTNNTQLQNITGKVEFILASQRGNNKPIPLQFESNGIKKIISILSGLIDAYNNEGCLIAIDEIDSGIFEYLLGELVYAFDYFGKGQLLFTSHNMRVLEKVNYKNIFFTTTSHDNAFIQLTNARDSNNLRDMYYRYIANDYDDKTKLYDMVKTEELISSLLMDKTE